ncbi:MAG: hypothetical protein MJZ30_09865 [Paludibacteraceae bacterium]|nr:hypothetical protein [Paludibacteraceae bacterium]
MGKVNNINVNSIELTNKKPNPSKGYEVRECEHQVDGEPWLMESDYYSGTTYADRRWEEKKVTDRGWHYLRICHKYVNGKVEVINSSIPEYRDLIKILGGKDDEIETGLFPYAIEALLDNGEKVDANKLKKVATQFGLTNPNEIIQQAELGVVKSARKIANNGESLRVRFEKIRDIYDLQPTISPKDGRANFLQQFSTPAPIAFLAGEFVNFNSKHAHYLEPSAGNGMLTIALPVDNTWVNDLDDVRYKNLLTQGFVEVTNLDASTIRTNNQFNGVITNPPFGRLSKKDFLVRKGRKGNKEIEYTFEVLDHKLAILALENMADNGRCAIIVGGKLVSKMYDHKKAFWKDDRLFGDFNVFVSYLNRQYNLIDILYISGDLYAKQGTTYPIVMLLIDGRKKWDAEPTAIWHKYDEKLDKPIESLSEYWDRMVGHIEKQETKQAPVQSSLVTFSNERVVKNYPEDYTAKDILFKGEKIGFAIMNESKTYYIDGDKLDYILNGRYTQKGSFLNIWCHSIYDKTKEHFTKESFFCDGLRFVFSQEDDVIKFMSLFDELFIKNAQSASSDLDRNEYESIANYDEYRQKAQKAGLEKLFDKAIETYSKISEDKKRVVENSDRVCYNIVKFANGNTWGIDDESLAIWMYRNQVARGLIEDFLNIELPNTKKGIKELIGKYSNELKNATENSTTNTPAPSSDLDRKRKLLILAKAKIKIAQAKAKVGKIDLSGLSGAETEHERKIANFIMEIGNMDLTDDENAIYEAFVETDSAKFIQIRDLLGLFNTLKIITNDYEYGSKHILVKHYGVKQDYVTADEIVKMCEIIKSVEPIVDEKKMNRRVYETTKDGVRFRLVIDINKDYGLLISFFSNRKAKRKN